MCKSCNAHYVRAGNLASIVHEKGCPEEWKQPRECAECGQMFTPEDRWQICCGESCYCAYNGIPLEEEEEEECLQD